MAKTSVTAAKVTHFSCVLSEKRRSDGTSAQLNKFLFSRKKEISTVFSICGCWCYSCLNKGRLHVFFSHPLFLSFVFYHLSAAREDKMFSENEIRNILFQVLSGLAFVHKHGKKPNLSFSSPFHFL